MGDYKYADDYATCAETFSTLRIMSDTLLPDEVTEALGLQPTYCFAKGETFGRANRQRKFNGWYHSTKGSVQSKDSRRHIDEILTLLDGKQCALDTLVEKGCEMDIMSYWVSIGHGGPILEPEQMARLARFKIKVWWDVYFDEPAGEDTQATGAHERPK